MTQEDIEDRLRKHAQIEEQLRIRAANLGVTFPTENCPCGDCAVARILGWPEVPAPEAAAHA